ncbi:MAG TPA: secretin N-terminal domain-containing protein [Thermodesulfovibrionales bacterium]|nr:secretin N-terminal domain-containing protein [Thermodesulfovibrionales bacterium]
MKSHAHRRQRGFLFLIIIVFIIIFGSLISENNSTPYAEQSAGILLRFAKHEGFERIVLEGGEPFINATKVTTFPSQLKIEFPEQLDLKAPQKFPFRFALRNKLLEINLGEEKEIKFFRLYSPSRLVFDIQKTAKQVSSVSSKNIDIKTSQGGSDPVIIIADRKINSSLVKKAAMETEEEENNEEEDEEALPAQPAPPAPLVPKTQPAIQKPQTPQTQPAQPAKPAPPVTLAPVQPAPKAPVTPSPAAPSPTVPSTEAKPSTEAAPPTEAQPPTEAKPPEAKEEEVPAKPEPTKPEKRPAADISFFFDDADIYEVIQTVFGEILKVNYIVDPKIKGRVNFRTTTPIPRTEVLPVMEIILRLNGIAVVEEMGLYRIISIADIPKEPAPIRFGRDPEAVELKGIATVQVVQLQYITSAEILKILTPLLSQGGAIIEVPPSFIIMADTDANVKRLLHVVEIFDSERLKLAKPQVFVYPVQNGKAKDVATMLQQIFLGQKPSAPTPAKTTTPAKTPSPTPAQPLTAGGEGGEAIVSEATRIFADEVTNTIIILATPEDFSTIAETIKKIDIVPRQVVIEALIVQVNLSDTLDFGLQWVLQNDLKITGLKFFNNPVTISGPLQLDARISGANFTFTAVDERNNTKLLLQSLALEGKAKILASPHILVSDNREASIQVGSQVPLATSTSTTPITAVEEVTSTITSSVQYKDIGIILKVKPQVNESGLVALEISQEISSLGANVTIAGQPFSSINKTEAKTNLVALDGQTIIIGGLIREDVTQSRSGIPFLYKIPVIGYLFGSTINEKTRNELIILLTPRVMRTVQEAKIVTSDYIDRFTKTTNIVIEGLIKEKKQELNPSPQ